MVNIDRLLRQAIFDDMLYCPCCDYRLLEPDYRKCSQCYRINPLKEKNLIQTVTSPTRDVRRSFLI